MTRPIKPVTVIGHAHENSHWALRDFMVRIAQPFNWVEAGACHLDFPEDQLPAIITHDNVNAEAIPRATVNKVAEAWSIRRTPEADNYDLAILGAGPAGLAAAVYAASDGLNTIVIETDLPGGQAGHTSKIENFFGFPNGIGGAELTQLALGQAAEFGAEICSLAPNLRVRLAYDGAPGFEIGCGDGWEIAADQVIAATGMQWRQMPEIDTLPNVRYGAGRSEAQHSANKIVAVIGGGNSAGQAAMDFAEAGAVVELIVRGDSLRKSMSDYLATRVELHEAINLNLSSSILGGGEARDMVELLIQEPQHDRDREEHRVTTADKVFVCIGGEPRTAWAAGLNLESEKGFLKTGPDLPSVPQAFYSEAHRPPLALETSVPGLFAAGDLRWGAPRRVGGAVGDGAAAVALAHRARQS